MRMAKVSITPWSIISSHSVTKWSSTVMKVMVLYILWSREWCFSNWSLFLATSMNSLNTCLNWGMMSSLNIFFETAGSRVLAYSYSAMSNLFYWLKLAKLTNPIYILWRLIFKILDLFSFLKLTAHSSLFYSTLPWGKFWQFWFSSVGWCCDTAGCCSTLSPTPLLVDVGNEGWAILPDFCFENIFNFIVFYLICKNCAKVFN